MFLPPKIRSKTNKKKTEINTYKNIGERNKSNQIAKNCLLSRYQRSR